MPAFQDAFISYGRAGQQGFCDRLQRTAQDPRAGEYLARPRRSPALGEAASSSAPGQDYWDIRNVCIQQALRFGSRSFGSQTAQAWFDQAVVRQQKEPNSQPLKAIAATQHSRISTKQYQQIARARPQLDNLYIDAEFRLVKTQREKSQRPSYTIAVRSPV